MTPRVAIPLCAAIAFSPPVDADPIAILESAAEFAPALLEDKSAREPRLRRKDCIAPLRRRRHGVDGDEAQTFAVPLPAVRGNVDVGSIRDRIGA
mmetsp:Transcript_30889/g.43050  ORF Transcript_30889/g.43050 Transcript_30889/m.43050 type:complete len:95 (+) Transcript_30889:595-879(+)